MLRTVTHRNFVLNIEQSELDLALLQLAYTSHEWKIHDLFQSVLVYLEKYNTLDKCTHCLGYIASRDVEGDWSTVQKILFYGVSLGNGRRCTIANRRGRVVTPIGRCVATHFEAHAQARLVLENTYSQKMLWHVLHQLPCATKARAPDVQYLVHAVMCHLEPIIDEDSIIIRLLQYFGWNGPDAALDAFSSAHWLRTWGPRVLQLSATAMRSPVAGGISVTIPCRVCVADMKHGGRMVVRSRRDSVGSKVCCLSCGREVYGRGELAWR